MITRTILSTIVGLVCAGLLGTFVGMPIHNWSSRRDQRNGVEPASRGCTGVLIVLAICLAGFVGGFIVGWKGL